MFEVWVRPTEPRVTRPESPIADVRLNLLTKHARGSVTRVIGYEYDDDNDIVDLMWWRP